MHSGKVMYAGAEKDGLVPGVRGHVLSRTAAYAHVQWTEGSCQGDVGIYALADLDMDAASEPGSITASLDDSLEVGSFVSMASAREAYEDLGGGGLVTHLAAGGYLSVYSSLAEEALTIVASRLQQDPVLQCLTASMDPAESDEVYRLAARTLMNESGDF
jgi:hypothetical protein